MLPGARPTREGRGPGTGDVSGTVIGFDCGMTRIGVAVGETATGIANPLVAIEEAANERRWLAIDRIVKEWSPVAFVVGEPRHADGSEHPVAKLAAKFARRLAARYGLAVALVDETLTSASAETELRAMRGGGGSHDGRGYLPAPMALPSVFDQPRDCRQPSRCL